MLKFVGFIAILVLFLFFIGFNLGDANKCDISFGFTTLKKVPVFFSAFASFVLGLLWAVPFTAMILKRRPSGASKKRGSFGGKKKGSQVSDIPEIPTLEEL